MIPIYSYSTNRIKLHEKNKSVNLLKNSLIKKHGKRCYICFQMFDRISDVELEHKVPIFAGGHIFSEENIDLVCKRCHKKKTNIDLEVIRHMKRIGIIKGKSIIESYYPIDKVIEHYKYIEALVLQIHDLDQITDEGSFGKDYYRVQQNSNRGGKNETFR